ncbi:MAG TPA: hypothetical protein VMS18_29845, partial [Candidatus Binatia bacterium]|nr:hypothetical protein [Candidatus Binatia bacterium]
AAPQGKQREQVGKGQKRATGRDEWILHHLGTLLLFGWFLSRVMCPGTSSAESGIFSWDGAPTYDANLGNSTSSDPYGNPGVVGANLSGLIGFLSVKSVPAPTDEIPTLEYNVGF